MNSALNSYACMLIRAVSVRSYLSVGLYMLNITKRSDWLKSDKQRDKNKRFSAGRSANYAIKSNSTAKGKGVDVSCSAVIEEMWFMRTVDQYHDILKHLLLLDTYVQVMFRKIGEFL